MTTELINLRTKDYNGKSVYFITSRNMDQDLNISIARLDFSPGNHRYGAIHIINN